MDNRNRHAHLGPIRAVIGNDSRKNCRRPAPGIRHWGRAREWCRAPKLFVPRRGWDSKAPNQTSARVRAVPIAIGEIQQRDLRASGTQSVPAIGSPSRRPRSRRHRAGGAFGFPGTRGIGAPIEHVRRHAAVRFVNSRVRLPLLFATKVSSLRLPPIENRWIRPTVRRCERARVPAGSGVSEQSSSAAGGCWRRIAPRLGVSIERVVRKKFVQYSRTMPLVDRGHALRPATNSVHR